MPGWVKALLDEWLQAANLTSGNVFRRVNKNGYTWGDGLTEKAVWHIVREYAGEAGIDRLAPHDLRRTCARLCHSAAGELEQIQFLFEHVSIQTTERYLGCHGRFPSGWWQGFRKCDSSAGAFRRQPSEAEERPTITLPPDHTGFDTIT